MAFSWAYLCKYLPKDIATTYDDTDSAPARVAHIDRLAEEVRWLPCAPTCANWLRFGIQPKDAGPGMVPGRCNHKAHDRANLGLGGRSVLVSRQWTAKTLAGHRADRAAVVRAALEEAGIDPDDHDELSITGTDGRWTWELLGRSRVDERTYAAAIAQQITTRQRWRAQYETAKATTAARAGPASPADVVRQFDPTAERKESPVDYEPLMVPKEPMLLTLKETAMVLRLGRSKLYELMAAGKLRSVKIGGSRRISATALAEFVAALEAEQQGDAA
jgi:excisionase family DNA binding protein